MYETGVHLGAVLHAGDVILSPTSSTDEANFNKNYKKNYLPLGDILSSDSESNATTPRGGGGGGVDDSTPRSKTVVNRTTTSSVSAAGESEIPRSSSDATSLPRRRRPTPSTKARSS